MGEWQALRPTVSLRCHSTDIAKHFGPGTSRRCRARVLYRRGRGCFAGVAAGFGAGVAVGCASGLVAGCFAGVPASCAIGVPAGFAAGVPGAVGPARPLAVRAASFARRVGSKPGQALRPPAPSTLVARGGLPGQCLGSLPYPLPGLIWIGCGHVDRLCTSG